MEDLLKLEHVSKRYRGFSLEDVNITLPAGCIMGLIGENGAGKTTTIKLILDLVRRDSGTIRIFGEDSRSLRRNIKEKIGVVMDSCCFSEELTGVQVGKVMRGIYRNWDQEQYEEMLSRYRISRKKLIKEYSKGMKMKLSLAAAISHSAELLILDEAAGGLDPRARETLLETFQDFVMDERHSVFVSSHILSDLEKVCDYITYIHGGRVLFSEEKDRLLESYGIVHCTERQLEELDRGTVAGVRKTAFGLEVLVRKTALPSGWSADPANLETIMLYYGREA